MAETTKKSVFDVMNSINVNDKTEKKNGLTYLSWAWAWGEVKKKYPDANYSIYENANGWNYHTDGRTAWVKVSVTINGIEHFEYLPVMDNRHKSIPLEQVTSMDVTRSIQRAVTKACARHGLGLYIYAGEDLPEEYTQESGDARDTARDAARTTCSKCKKVITDDSNYTAKAIIEESTKKLGKPVCLKCWREMAQAVKSKEVKSDG